MPVMAIEKSSLDMDDQQQKTYKKNGLVCQHDFRKENNLNILHFYKTYYPETVGGIEQVIYQLCEGTKNLGINSSVLTLSDKPSDAPVTIGSHQVFQARTNFTLASNSVSWRSIKQLRELALQADLIHYHFPWPFMDVAHFLSGLKTPNIVTYHSDIVRQKTLLKFYSPLMHRFLKQTDRIIATSPNYRASSPVLNQYAEKTSVIPLGLDRSLYEKPSAELIKSWQGRIQHQRFFLFVGVMRYYKGLHILLESLQGTDIKVLIAGSGPLEDELIHLSYVLGVQKNVEFLGQISEQDKAALLHLCYAVVFPSYLRSEAFGISLLEGAMFGKPMVSCEIGTGTSYINQHLETGLVVEPDNPTALRRAMKKLLESPEMATFMGRNAADRFEQHFTAQQMSNQYASVYREVLAQKVTSGLRHSQ